MFAGTVRTTTVGYVGSEMLTNENEAAQDALSTSCNTCNGITLCLRVFVDVTLSCLRSQGSNLTGFEPSGKMTMENDLLFPVAAAPVELFLPLYRGRGRFQYTETQSGKGRGWPTARSAHFPGPRK